MSHLARVTLTTGRKGLLIGESRVVAALPKQILSYRPKTTYTEKLTSLKQYEAEKKAAKELRTELHNKKVERKEGLKTRQNPDKKNFLKKQFRQWFDNISSKQAYLDREARRQGKEWKINVAAMVERLPVVTPDREQWESDYMQLQSELSKYDDIAYPKELGFEDPMDRKIYTEEELLELLPEGFNPAPRETEADKSGDIQTLNRQLKTRVYFSLEQENGWQLPTVALNENESFLDGAKRAVKDIGGGDLSLICLSNCPMGVTVTEYSEEQKADSGVFGEKTFYMRVQYDDGDVNKNKLDKLNDWGWLAREEMVEKVSAAGEDENTALFYKYML